MVKEKLSTTVMNKVASFVKKYAIIISLITYFGIDKGMMQFFEDGAAALKNPKEMATKYTKDSTKFVNRIDALEMKVKIMNQEIKMLKDIDTHIMTGLSILSDCTKEELELKHIWDFKVYETNPGNMWVFRTDKKYPMRTPLSLKVDWQEHIFWYTPIGHSNRIPLEK